MDKLKEELAASSELKHVEEASDRSAPQIETNIKVKESPMVALQKEIEEKKDEIADFAATGGVKVAKEEVMGEIAKGAADLKHVEEGADRSAPLIESDVTIKPSPMADLKKEIASSSPELKHVDEAADRSAPVVEADVKVKASLMPQLADEIKQRTSAAIELS